MGTSKYLNSILRVMPAVQARQITDVLSDLQAVGTVRNADEYRQKLQELSIIVNDSVPKPSFEQVRALVWNLCSSDAHNIMMKSFKNDVEAAFLQVDEIGTKLDEHNELLMKSIVADLERGLDEQASTILRLEWLANQANEFTQVLVNSFTSSSLLKVTRSDLGADSLYFDNRTYKKQTQVELPSAVISERGQKLLLDINNNPVIYPVGVQLSSNSNSYNSEINVDIDNDITNTIDAQRNTFWFRNVYLSETVPKVTTVMNFDLGNGIDVGYIIIEGSTQEPFFIEGIIGISPDGHRISLYTASVEVNGKQRIDFARSFLSSVEVTFAVYTYHKADYWIPKRSDVHEALSTDNRFNRIQRRDFLAPVSRDALISEKLADLCNVPLKTAKPINFYRYTFALDNVWFGNNIYQDTGIFVSKPLKVNNIGVLAVQVDELAETGIDKNLIEYEIIKIDTTPKYKEIRFPILKIGESSSITERLIFTKRETDAIVNDVGMLRFCPYIASDWTSIDDDPIIVYKNGVALVLNTDWEYAFAEIQLTNQTLDWKTGFSDGVTFSNYTMSPPKVWIKVKNIKLNDVYTVIYTPRTSDYNVNSAGTNETDTNTLWLDKDQTVFLNKDGRVHFKRENADVTIVSDIYLQITLRRNKPSQASSPELYEYAVLATSYN